ncbi:kynureninase [Ammoniphilus resinae]|uniref:Kynureninase n=1 Tax=Ammoniphilus resinae TaxID=861532 RepID=A0ABS4GKR7_9BACL|nr:kynureninase [Ammoniphilus resinae]MBP1930853.1 kynureninase [Ammoniphilus resinae]
MSGSVQWTKDYAEDLDGRDPLRRYRMEFYLRPNTIYLDGNSLGLLSKRAEKSLLACLEDWKEWGIDGWTHGRHPWFYLSEQLGEKLALFIGAEPQEVILTGSTTVNLHQLVSTFYKPEGKRTKILADALTFPSDIYALQSQLSLRGLSLEEHLMQVQSRDGRMLAEDDLVAAMSEEVALIILPTVLYRSGQLLDIEKLTTEAHKRGILIGFDACHSVGAVAHEFSKWNVDFAFWCNYKYLNGGPGCVAGLYVNRKHLGNRPGLAGWFGSKKEKQFDMEFLFHPADSAGAYQIGTPHILSLAPLIGSLDMFMEAGIENIRKKSLQLTQYLMDLIHHELGEYSFTIGNPLEDHCRGGHVCLEHDEAVRITKALKVNRVIPDFRSPNIIRLAPVALYNSYSDIWQVVQILKTIMVEKQYEKFSKDRDVVA